MPGSPISVNPKADDIELDQPDYRVPHGSSQITWKLPANSRFEFADPPVTFYGEDPTTFQPVTIGPRSVTYVDNNNNTTGQDIAYPYSLHLRVGKLMVTYPDRCGIQLRAGPYIRNKPK